MAKAKKAKGPQTVILVAGPGSASEIVKGQFDYSTIYGVGATEAAALEDANNSGDVFNDEEAEVITLTVSFRKGKVVQTMTVK